MKIRYALIALTVSVRIATAQDDRIVKLIKVHGDAANIEKLACSGGSVICQVSDAMHAIVLRGSPTQIEQTERIIGELDSLSTTSTVNAKKNVETTIYIIAASAEGVQDAPEAGGEALAPVIKQLKATFPYVHYQLVSSMLLRSDQEAGADTSGIMKTLGDVQQPQTYSASYAAAKWSESGTIHIKKLLFKTRIATRTSTATMANSDIGVQTDIDLREGQKVVINKTNIPGLDTALFVVVSARLVP